MRTIRETQIGVHAVAFNTETKVIVSQTFGLKKGAMSMPEQVTIKLSTDFETLEEYEEFVSTLTQPENF